MNYYERHIGDYLKDTSHLTLLEHGVYSRLLDVYYTRECAIPDAHAARLIGARTKEEKSALRVVLQEFFIQEEHGDWIQQRCEQEIKRYLDKSSKARAAVSLRWEREKNARNTDVNTEGHSERTTDVDTDVSNPYEERNTPRARSQTPDTRHQPRSKASGGRATRLPADWSPSDEDLAYASRHGLVNGRASVEAEKFRNYWTAKSGKDATKLDWAATWRNWVLSAAQRQPAAKSDDVFAGSL